MEENQIPSCTHDNTPMRRVWSDGHGKAVYQCPACGRKIDAPDHEYRR